MELSDMVHRPPLTLWYIAGNGLAGAESGHGDKPAVCVIQPANEGMHGAVLCIARSSAPNYGPVSPLCRRGHPAHGETFDPWAPRP